MTLLIATGCSGTVAYRGSASATVVAEQPDLVYVSPGVQVIADYDEPVFYTDNYYWRFDGGVWYRSHNYTGGWAYASPPRALVRIDRPHAYVHYRPHGYVARRPARRTEPVIRDHRTPDRPQPVPQTQPRDRNPYGQDRRDEAQDRREQKQDQRQDQREEKREEKREQREEKRDEKRDDKRDRRDDKNDRRDKRH